MILKNAFKKVLNLTGGFPVSNLYSGIGHILMFHSVVPEQKKFRISNNFLEVSPEHLEMVIGFFIRNNYQIISLDQMHELLVNGNYKEKFVVFTFDDGYLDNLTYAYPVFKKFQVPFTIYITTNFPDKKTVIWWYPLEEIIRENQTILFYFKGKQYAFTCVSPEEKLHTFIQIRAIIQSCSEEEVGGLLNNIFTPFGIDLRKVTDALVMNWDQIRVLSQDPLVIIGAHTVNHYRLGALTSEEVHKEIQDSVSIIQDQIGKEVFHFSYPFGTRNDIGQREFKIAKTSGLKTAATTRPANIFKEHKHALHALPRINIDMETDEKVLQDLIMGFTHFVANRGRKVITD